MSSLPLVRPDSPSAERSVPPVLRLPPHRIPRVLVVFFAAKLCAAALLLAHFPRSALFVFFGPDSWLFFHIARPTSRGLGPVVTRFETSRREVWLTIDDGPEPATTPRLLDLLDKEDAKATFFLVGKKVDRHPELVREIARRGHAIANHTYTHPSSAFWLAGPGRTRREIDRCTEAFARAGVQAAPWFRPPVGIKNIFLHGALHARGLALIMWSARGYDRINHAEISLWQITRGLQPGAIILVHEGLSPGENAEPLIAPLLDYLREQGLRCILPTPESLRS